MNISRLFFTLFIFLVLILIGLFPLSIDSWPGILYNDYSTYIGGSSTDNGRAVSVDSSGCVYVTGDTLSTNFPTENPYQAQRGGGSDAFVCKLTSSGTGLIYSTYLGGGGANFAYDVVVDDTGAAYVAGYTNSTNFPTMNPYQSSNAGDNDAFVCKLISSGTALEYSTYLGGNSYDVGEGLDIDVTGAAYVTGFAYSTDFPTENPFQAGMAGGADVFAGKLSPSGSVLLYGTYLGGNTWDYGRDISIDDTGNAYVTGSTESTNFPTENPYQSSKSVGSDSFISKLTSSGSALAYSTYLGASGSDYGESIVADSSGCGYMSGYTSSPNFPTNNPYQASYGGGSDAFIIKLDSSASTLLYSTYLGGSINEYGWALDVGDAGDAYLAGHTNSPDFPTANPYQPVLKGGNDIFIGLFASSGSMLIYSTYLGGIGNDSANGVVADISNIVYLAGNTGSSDFPTANSYQSGLAGSGDVFVSRLEYVLTPTPSATVTPTPSVTPSPSVTCSPTPSTTLPPTPSKTPTTTPSSSPTPSVIPTPSISPTISVTPTASMTPTLFVPSTPTPTPSPKESPGAAEPPWIYDYNGDGTSDIGIFRGSSGLWSVRGITRVYFGSSIDEPVPGDYNGNGTTDFGIFRGSSGLWAVSLVTRVYFGSSIDEPVPGDYNGDGTWSPGIFRSSSGLWAIRGTTRVYFGSSIDEPVPGYFGGTGSRAIGIYRASSGLWAIRGITRVYFGSSIDEPVPGDYNGDGTWSPGIFRSSSGLWAIRGITRIYFGSSIDNPVPADYNGDSRDDVGIFRSYSGLWAVKGISRLYYGASNDVPVVR